MLDVHTHCLTARNAIISVEPGDFKPSDGLFYSVGIHPWSASCDVHQEALLRSAAAHPQVVAIGECGIDLVRSALTEAGQIELTLLHARLAEELHKPLVLHCVRAYHIIARLLKEFRPTQPWIIHGFRGNATVAQQLLRYKQVWLSFGERFNANALAATPQARRLAETDCSERTIEEIAAMVNPTVPDFFAFLPK
ncbi:MAG: TatD family hydrolase [Muribaculaceae bacterium]